MIEPAHYLQDKPELHTSLMQKLVAEILKDVDIKEDDKQDEGVKVSIEWCEGKSMDEQVEILIEKFGTDEEKSEYDSWKSEL